MIWREAVEKSNCGAALREEKLSNGLIKTFVRYDDGSGYVMVAEEGKINHDKCREPRKYELDGYINWEPLENKEL